MITDICSCVICGYVVSYTPPDDECPECEAGQLRMSQIDSAVLERMRRLEASVLRHQLIDQELYEREFHSTDSAESGAIWPEWKQNCDGEWCLHTDDQDYANEGFIFFVPALNLYACDSEWGGQTFKTLKEAQLHVQEKFPGVRVP